MITAHILLHIFVEIKDQSFHLVMSETVFIIIVNQSCTEGGCSLRRTAVRWQVDRMSEDNR